MEEKKQSKSLSISLLKWKLNEEELKNQVDNYNTLGFTKSVRKVATVLLILSVVITLIIGLLEIIPLGETWLDIILLAVLAIFVYKGNKVAIILAMAYWTFAKGYQIVSNPQQALWAIIWWAAYMGIFFQAYQVEKARHKISQEKTEKPVVHYCQKCGAQIQEGSKFCTKCGNKISIF
ncbi:MAG: zinc ribbon domain-containing protein [Candidatus Paceibacterota bacterium]